MGKKRQLLGAGKMTILSPPRKNIQPLHFESADIEGKKELIKRTICKNSSDDELQLFIHACKRTGLDPFMKQIHAVKRGEIMTIQTGIDGLRLIADRSGNYAPGREPTFQYDGSGKVKSATAYIKKRTQDGEWHEVSATAFYDEYKPGYKNNFWDTKPHIMLSKCAEALALRKAFPAEMSGIYTSEEMEQANEAQTVNAVEVRESVIEVQENEEYLNELIDNLFHKMTVPSPAHFDSYLKFVQSKLNGRKIGSVISGWLKDPEPFLNHYKNWIEKNKLDTSDGQISGEVVNI